MRSQSLTSEDIIFLVFIPPSLAVLFLSKVSYLILFAAMIVFYAIYLLQNQRIKLGLLLPVIFIVSVVFFWVISGNPTSDITDYVTSMMQIVSGYTDAMTIYGHDSDIVTYLFISLILLVYIGYALRCDRLSAVFLICSVFTALFLSFKAAFVRHDAHALIAAPLPFMLCATLFTMPASKRSSFVLALITFTAFAYMLHLSVRYSGSAIASNFIHNIYRNWSCVLTGCLSDNRLRERFEAANHEIAKRDIGIHKIPNDERPTVDLYTMELSLLFAKNMNWQPRPVFQSYSAYTSHLSEMNRQHLESDNAPDIILFSLEVIDGRYPLMEDGSSIPEILRSYVPIHYDKYITLKKEPIARQLNRQVLIEDIYSMGQTIELPDDSGILYLRLEIDKTFFGKGMSLFFKSVPIYINITMANGNKHTHRLIPSVTNSGFILSPYVNDNMGFSLLFSHDNVLTENSVKSFRVTADNPVFAFWANDFTARLEKLEYDRGHAISKWLNLEVPIPDLPSQTRSTAFSKCVASLDEVKLSESHNYFTVKGWVVQEIEQEVIWNDTYLKLQSENGTRFLKVQRTARPDLATHFGKSSLSDAGFELFANVSELTGDHRMSLSMMFDDSTVSCENISREISF